jgi:hypothetical protein
LTCVFAAKEWRLNEGLLMSAKAASDRYFYRAPGGMEQGPVNVEELRALIREKKVTLLYQVRSEDCGIWRSASDLPVLQEVFYPGTVIWATGFESKPLSALQVEDLPRLGVYLAQKILPWVALLCIYVPGVIHGITLLVGLLMTDNLMRRTTGTGVFGGLVNMTIPLLCIVWVWTVPLGILIAYWKRRLNVTQFLVAGSAAYFVVLVGSWIWLYQTQLTFLDLMARFFSLPRRL